MQTISKKPIRSPNVYGENLTTIPETSWCWPFRSWCYARGGCPACKQRAGCLMGERPWETPFRSWRSSLSKSKGGGGFQPLRDRHLRRACAGPLPPTSGSPLGSLPSCCSGAENPAWLLKAQPGMAEKSCLPWDVSSPLYGEGSSFSRVQKWSLTHQDLSIISAHHSRMAAPVQEGSSNLQDRSSVSPPCWRSSVTPSRPLFPSCCPEKRGSLLGRWHLLAPFPASLPTDTFPSPHVVGQHLHCHFAQPHVLPFPPRRSPSSSQASPGIRYPLGHLLCFSSCSCSCCHPS